MGKIRKLDNALMVTAHLPEEGRSTATSEITSKINEIIDWINHAGCNQTIKNNQRITPIQTPNPQSVFNKVEGLLGQIISNSKRDYDKDGKRTITIRLDKLQKLIANGETPEVDNTVGQVDYLKLFDEFLKESYFENLVHKGQAEIYIKNFIKTKLMNKPVETTKEQPIRIWKLHCKNKDNNYKASLEMFQGNPLELSLHITNINSKNYSYFIVDFEEVC